MAKLKKGTTRPWMIELAEKHNIEVETVQHFYESLEYIPHHGSLRQRTIDFFDLYFQGIKEGVNGKNIN